MELSFFSQVLSSWTNSVLGGKLLDSGPASWKRNNCL
jgi:hypothetical protein